MGSQWLATLAAQTPEPSPTDPGMTIYTVTPGITGFLAFFAIALAGWLLFRSMGRRMRNVDQARRERERADAEAAAAAEATEGAAPAPGDGAGDTEDAEQAEGDARP